jgi:hypothetical protein
MYFTDRGIEELQDRRGEESATFAALAEHMRQFVDLNPEHEIPIDRLATWPGTFTELAIHGTGSIALPPPGYLADRNAARACRGRGDGPRQQRSWQPR